MKPKLSRVALLERTTRRALCAGILVLLHLFQSNAVASTTANDYNGGTYTQNFDGTPYNSSGAVVAPAQAPVINGTTYTLPTAPTAYDLLNLGTVTTAGTNLTGWYALSPAKNVYGANGGSTTTGGIYSFGGTSGAPLADRSLGIVSTSTSGLGVVGVLLHNNTSNDYNQITLSYDAKLWHQGTAAKSLNFGYLVGATISNLPTTGLTAVAALNSGSFTTGTLGVTDLQAPVATHSPSVTSISLGSTWTHGTYLWLTWTMDLNTGSGQGIGIDNLSFSAAAVAAVANVTWNTTSGTWDTTTGNWTGGSPTANLFKTNDNATFANTAGGTISVPASVTPGSSTVSAASGTYSFSGAGQILGVGAFAKAGAGSLDFTGLSNGNGFSGGLSVTGGQLTVSNDNQFGTTAGTLNFDSGATLALNSPVTINASRSLTLGSGGVTLSQGTNALTVGAPVTLNGPLTINGTGPVTFSGVTTFGGSGALSIPTGGAVILAQPGTTIITMPAGGTFNGNLIINTTTRINLDTSTYGGAGTIYILGSALGSTTITAGSLGTPNAQFSNLAATAGGTLTSNIVLNPPNSGILTGHVTFTTGSVTTANYTPASYLAFIGGTSSGFGLLLNGAISGEGDLFIGNDSKIGGGGGTLTLNASCSYSGNTLINTAGTVLLGATNALPVTTNIVAGSLSGFGNCSLDLHGNNQQIASLSDDTAKAAIKNLTITNSGVTDSLLLVSGAVTPANVFAGIISDGATNKVALTKAGTNALFLNGTSTYSGTTTISGGDLRGTGTLSNSGVQASNALTASIWPGVAVTGNAVPTAGETFNVAGLDLSGGGKLKIALNTSDVSTSTQKLAVTGSTILTNGTLSLGIPQTASIGNTYVILTSSTTITTRFLKIVLNGNTITSGGGQLTVNYNTNSVSVTINGGVTPVTIDDFTASISGTGTVLEWNCASEFQNAGFNLYRRSFGSETAAWLQINPALITGRLSNPDSHKYQFYDWSPPGTYEYRLESISVQGCAESYPVLAGPVTLDDALPFGDAISTAELEAAEGNLSTFASVSQSSELSKAVSQALRDRALGAANVRTLEPSLAPERSKRAAQAPSLSGALAGVRWFSNGSAGPQSSYSAAKLSYSAAGVLLIPQAQLPAGMDVHSLAVQRAGVNLPVLALTNKGALVYGPGYEDDYTNTDAIFLRSTGAATKAGSATRASGLFALPQEHLAVVTPAAVGTTYHDVYFDYGSAYRPYSYAPWFAAKYLTANDTSGTSQSFTINTPFAVAGSSATLTVNLWSLTQSNTVPQDHILQVAVNGQPAGQAQWSGGGRMLQLTFQISAPTLIAGDNIIALNTPAIAGVPNQIAFLHSLTCNYTKSLDGSQPADLKNADSTQKIFEMYNLPAADAWVVDVTYPERAALVMYDTQQQPDGTYKLRFPASPGGSYKVVPTGHENAPLSIVPRQVRAVRGPAAYLATGPSQFGSPVQPLVMQRAKEGIRGFYVDQEQLFDYYNYGRYGPVGIQNAVRALRPHYLLLLGRTTYDYKNYSGLNVDPLCPTFLVSTTFWAQSTSDSMFADLGRGFPQAAVGRIPANTPAELTNAVNHILGYSGAPLSGIRVHAVADQADPGVADFPSQTATLAQSFPDLSWQPNYLGRTWQTSPEVSTALTAAANGGADWIVYIGHGNASGLGNESPQILTNSTVQTWNKNVILLQSTCTASWMAKNTKGYKSIAIQALTQPQGGISASIATSTYMVSDYAVPFMNQLLKNAAAPAGRWGDTLLKTQQWAFGMAGTSNYYLDLANTEQLFGDPAMPVYSRPAATPAVLVPPGSTQSSAAPAHAGQF